jgi:hypothetical protein
VPRTLVVIEEVMFDGKHSNFEPVGDTEFLEDGREVILHCLLAESETRSDFFVACSADDGIDDIQFPAGEAVSFL